MSQSPIDEKDENHPPMLPLDLAEGNTWTNVTSLFQPPRGDSNAMAYDTNSDRVVLYGPGSGTWAYDANTKTWRKMNSTPASWLSSGLRHVALAYDSESDRAVLFGFFQEGFRFGYGTWAYDLNTDTWTDMSPASGPRQRYNHALAYDTESDRAIMFGGFFHVPHGGEWALGDTWAYDFNSNTWIDMNVTSGPSNRSGHAMAYDTESDRVILFGGGDSEFAKTAETWAYDFDTSMWKNMNPAIEPPARYLHSMAYDEESDRVILFAGSSLPEEVLADTWAYDLNTNTWTDMSPASGPSARYGHAMAYDAESDRVILFDGFFHTPQGTREALSDTWHYQSATAPSPPRDLQAIAGNGDVALIWQIPWSDGGTPAKGYRIYRGTLPGAPSFLAEVGNVLSFTDVGLTNGVTYFYQVAAVSAVGEGPRTPEVSATPSPPQDTTKPTVVITSPLAGATLTSSSVTVSGSASDDVGLQKVEISADGMTWVPATGTASWSGALTLRGGSQTIYARATDSSGNTATISIGVTVSVVPSGESTQWELVAVAIVVTTAVAAIASLYLVRMRRPPGGAKRT